MKQSLKDQMVGQSAALTLGAAAGAITKHAITPSHGRGALAMQVGSAVGAASAAGAGLSGSMAAGAAVVTAKVATVAAFGVAAAPLLVAAGAGYGLYKFFKSL